MRRTSPVLLGAIAALGLATASCGGDDAASSDASTATTPPRPGAPGVAGEITVFAAASLTDAFEAIGDAFGAANPDASVTFSFAGSSDLVAQIRQGAPADVFASADLGNMQKLTEAGGHAGEPEVFATNQLAIITAPGNPRAITGVADLADPGLIVVTCAVEVPCGAYSQELFANAGVTVTPESYEENVKGVANKVLLGEADAGIVYWTDVIAAGDDAAGVEVPAEIGVTARYPIVVTADAPDPEAASAFVDFVLGAEGRAILAELGFTGP